MYKLLIFLMLFVGNISKIQAMPTKEELLNLSLATDHKIKNKIAELKRQNYTLKSVVGENLFDVNLSYNHINVVELHNENDNYKSEYDVDELEILATQKIINPDLIPIKKISSLKIKRIKTEISNLISQRLLETVISLIDLEILNYEEKFLEKNLSYANELLKITQIQENNGQATKLDFLNAKQNLLQNKTLLIEKKKEKANQFANLEKLTNITNFVTYNFQPELDLFKIHSLENLLKKLYSNNYNLTIKNFDVAIAKSLNSLDKSKYLPKASLFYSYNSSKGGFSFSNNNYDKTSQRRYGINVTVPLFSSGKRYFDTKQSSMEIVEKSEDYNDEKRNAKEEIINLWENIQISEVIIKQNIQAKEIAETALEIAKSEYLANKISFTDLLDSQNNFIESENNLVISKLNQQKDNFRILYIIGALTPEFFDIKFQLK